MEVFTMVKQNGSEIAKSGFQSEKDIVNKFNNWKEDEDSKQWLKIMGYKLSEIVSVKSNTIRNNKTDIQVKILKTDTAHTDTHNIQVKSLSSYRGFNQVDKRWIDNYQKMWNIPDDITELLKYYTGELKPCACDDKKRIYLNEFSTKQQKDILNFFNDNKIGIICDLLRGRGPYSTEWILVVQKTDNIRWILQPINKVINYYSKGEVFITPKGNLKIGKISMQRKGGDKGKKSANMLQFKINPAKLFEI